MTDFSGEKAEGYIDHIIFRNEENGYTVFSLVADGEELTCVGFFQFLNAGETIEAFGRYTEHSAYGRQFKVDSFRVKTPENAEAMERYLGSGAIKGIGAALAARIVKEFGEDTLRILREEPERLAEVRGISERRAQEIAVQVSEQEEMRSAMIFLQQYGISLSLAVKIYQAYGQELYDILQQNPYRMAEDIDGVGFRMADEIASKIGIESDSEYRIRSGLLYVLNAAAAEGSVYLPQDILISRTEEILGVPEEAIEKCIGDLAIEHKVVLKDETDGKSPSGLRRIVYAGTYYYLELNCARMLNALNVVCEDDEEKIEKKIRHLGKHDGIVLEKEQEEAVRDAVRHGLLIMTGGPGTGKTTTINEMIRYFESEKMDFVLAAPTGRAARRMTEATGYEASTIHKLLEIAPTSGNLEGSLRFSRNEQNPLTADVVIIDEMSMVDIFLMHALLSAIPVGTRLILAGDVDQLPSVGPGDVLADMIRSEAFPTVRLTKIFRQAEGSDIVVNAHRINHGEQIALTNQSRDFFFLKRSDANLIISNMIELIRDKLPAYVHARPFDIQVLTPMHKGLLGVERLNGILQQYLNPPSPKKAEKSYGERIFRVGDKVMQIRNNYQLEWEIRGKYGIAADRGVGIFNGDMGIIRSISPFASSMEIEFDGGRFVDYPFSEMEQLELSYAITIHKSQGSEYAAVLIPLLGGSKMLLTRNLLYTAVTRAKSCVTILGSEETVREMIGNRSEKSRYTSLDLRIREMKI
ncbi:MAG: ATP-dependent RecD-like DNA helicase [Lachnospiraceae bacterium]|jgi:exodeoxyribonuclease V alpha subunit|nr:ATP-dependent RecD-like DNA helicase [Lachnospiraceae bacterium]MCI1726438.1 ATP-dependent RecD-like DNA helicase [Lachnospiraceae bacterium]